MLPFVLFETNGVWMIGNPDTGLIIGLESNEAEQCRRLIDGKASLASLSQDSQPLYSILSKSLSSTSSPAQKCAYLHITDRCNLRCRGCYSWVPNRNDSADPTLSELKTALRFLARWGAQEVVISGGEPFLRNDLSDLLKFAKDKLLFPQISLLTNGTIDDAALLCGIAPFVDVVSVSFDTFELDCSSYIRGKNRFLQLCSFVRKAQEAGLHTCITATIHEKNASDLGRYQLLAETLNAELNFSILSPSPSNNAPNDLLLSKNSLESLADGMIRSYRPIPGQLDGLSCKTSCGAGTSVLSISPKGEVFPCHMLHTDAFCLGNAFSDTPSELTYTAINAARKSLACSKSNCDNFFLCGGGCLARAINTRQVTDPYCALFKRFNLGVLEKTIESKETN